MATTIHWKLHFSVSPWSQAHAFRSCPMRGTSKNKRYYRWFTMPVILLRIAQESTKDHQSHFLFLHPLLLHIFTRCFPNSAAVFFLLSPGSLNCNVIYCITTQEHVESGAFVIFLLNVQLFLIIPDSCTTFHLTTYSLIISFTYFCFHRRYSTVKTNLVFPSL